MLTERGGWVTDEILVRALALARSGEYADVGEIKARLVREGYADAGEILRRREALLEVGRLCREARMKVRRRPPPPPRDDD